MNLLKVRKYHKIKTFLANGGLAKKTNWNILSKALLLNIFFFKYNNIDEKSATDLKWLKRVYQRVQKASVEEHTDYVLIKLPIIFNFK